MHSSLFGRMRRGRDALPSHPYLPRCLHLHREEWSGGRSRSGGGGPGSGPSVIRELIRYFLTICGCTPSTLQVQLPTKSTWVWTNLSLDQRILPGSTLPIRLRSLVYHLGFLFAERVIAHGDRVRERQRHCHRGQHGNYRGLGGCSSLLDQHESSVSRARVFVSFQQHSWCLTVFLQ